MRTGVYVRPSEGNLYCGPSQIDLKNCQKLLGANGNAEIQELARYKKCMMSVEGRPSTAPNCTDKPARNRGLGGRKLSITSN